MFLSTTKSFLSVLNNDALVFLGMRLASIVLGILSIILLCRAVTIQYYFLTDGLGQVYDMLPLGPLIYSMTWSVVSMVLPGCKRKYHPALDMVLDFFGCTLTSGAGAVLLIWSLKDAYEVEFCRAGFEDQCFEASSSLSTTEKSGAILLFLTGITHLVMFIRACRAVHSRRKRYTPSRNSFMQLQKDSDHSLSTSPLDLNATTLIAADAKVQQPESFSKTTEEETNPVGTNNCPV